MLKINLQLSINNQWSKLITPMSLYSKIQKKHHDHLILTKKNPAKAGFDFGEKA